MHVLLADTKAMFGGIDAEADVEAEQMIADRNAYVDNFMSVVTGCNNLRAGPST